MVSPDCSSIRRAPLSVCHHHHLGFLRDGARLFITRICPIQNFETIAKSLAEGVGVASIARIQNVDKKTVLLVLAKAAEQAKRVSRSLLMNVKVTECQLDEMWSFVGKKEKNLDPVEKLQRSLGDAWIWDRL